MIAIERDGRRRVAGARPTRATSPASTWSLHRQFRPQDRGDGRASTSRSSPSSTSTSSPSRIPPSWSGTGRACPRWACCARATPPGTCARRPAACSSAPTRRARPVCYVDGPDEESEYELFQEDLERLSRISRRAIVRVPAFGEVGIKKVYNGAIAYTPDGSPIVGPGLGPEEFLAERGPLLRRHGGRRRGLAARRMDRRWRADHRHDGRRPAPLRPLRLARLPAARRTRRPTPTSSRRTIPTRSARPRGR